MQFKRYREKLNVKNDVLLFSSSKGVVPVVSHELVIEVALVLHYHLAHIGRDKVRDLIDKHLWHPYLARVVSDVCTTCEKCQLSKIHQLRVLPPTTKIITNSPFELMAADLVEFGRTSRGNVACLMLVDHHSKFLAAVPLQNKRSQTVADALSMRILPFLPRLPEKLLTDNGPEFRAAVFEEVLEQYGIRHIYSTPYKPSSNGAVERVNRTIKGFLANLSSSPWKWDDSLPKAVMTYNSTMHREIGCAPSDYLLSKPHELTVMPPLSTAVKDVWKLGHPRFSPFMIDDRVIRKIPFHGQLNVHKFMNKYDGPYRVVSVNRNAVTYELSLVSDPRRVIRAHYTQLHQWKDVPRYLSAHPYFRKMFPSGERAAGRLVSAVPSVPDAQLGYVSPVSSSDAGSADEEESVLSDESSQAASTSGGSRLQVPVGPGPELASPQDLDAATSMELSPKSDEIPVSSLASGIILERVDETWEFSSISGDACISDGDLDASLQPPAESVRLAVNSVVTLAELTLSQVGSLVENCLTYADISFHSFSSMVASQLEMSPSQTMDKLRKIQGIVKGEADSEAMCHRTIAESDEGGRNCVPTRMTPESVGAEQQVMEAATGMQTRSQGPAIEVPHVQPRILERKLRR